MRMQRVRTRVLAAVGGVGLVAATLLVTPLASAESTKSATSGSRDALPADPVPRSTAPAALPERFTGQKLTWRGCGGDVPAEIRCTTIDAPLDYFRPEAGSLRVTFSRLTTADPAKRRGILLLNPGGPGDSGLSEPHWRARRLPKEVLEQYDLVGFDPRGVGQSTPLKCGLEGDELSELTAFEPDDFAHDVSVARSVAGKCARTPTAGHISTRNTARDMDLFRILLHEPKISYFGVSYGTYLGAVYTQLFPGRTDRVVLDSNIDPALAWRGVFGAMTVNGAEAFQRFTRWAAKRDRAYHLGKSPQAVENTFWKLAERVDHHPIVIDGEKYTKAYARAGMANAAFEPEQGVAFLVDLRNALNGKPHELLIPQEGEGDDAMTSLHWAVLCNDASDWPRGAQTYYDDAVRSVKRYPLLGDAMTNVTPCAFWSLPPEEPDFIVGNDARVLLLQNEWDMATPGTMGRGLHRALSRSRLVMVKEGLAHGVYTDGNPCATKVTDSYLTTGKLPAKDVSCPKV
jgi:pimeloyl-ACP methyl ester carboxylesterase